MDMDKSVVIVGREAERGKRELNGNRKIQLKKNKPTQV